MISIIIRAKDEMPWLKYTLRLLNLQERQDFELICVDSGSQDGSWELLQSTKTKLCYRIKPEDYIPGKVLNQAIAQSSGEIIVFNNADCIPLNRFWLSELLRPLETDASIAAAYACQIARPDAHPMVQKDYERAFGDGRIAASWKHFFSLASSAVRRDLIQNYPFNEEISYSEDIEWSWRMKSMGYKIAYAPEAKVWHSHNYNLKQIKKRYLGEGKAEAYIYRDHYEEHPEEKSFARSVLLSAGMETLRDAAFLLRKGRPDWLPKAPLYRLAQRYYAWKGRNS
ncbi:MAG TPA: glycosyltransferase [Candidatus Cloacimonadota bacterium]|nr:glycosyltransferase [Candidatus Cloacimonadota bacterium]